MTPSRLTSAAAARLLHVLKHRREHSAKLLLIDALVWKKEGILAV